MKAILPTIIITMLAALVMTALVSCAAHAEPVERIHLDAYDVPLMVPPGELVPSCVVDLHKANVISTLAFVGYCSDVLPEIKHRMEADGVTTIVTLSINGHNINLT